MVEVSAFLAGKRPESGLETPVRPKTYAEIHASSGKKAEMKKIYQQELKLIDKDKKPGPGALKDKNNVTEDLM